MTGVLLFLDFLKDWQTLVAGFVGFGGLAWVTNRNARLERQAALVADQALVVALTLELIKIKQELRTARKILQNSDGSTSEGQRVLSNAHSSRFFELSLERSSKLPISFLAACMDFLHAKREVCEKYSSIAGTDRNRAVAAIMDVEQLLEPVLNTARNAVPAFEFTDD